MKRNQFLIAIFMLVATFTSVALFSSCSESKGDEVDESTRLPPRPPTTSW